MTKLANTCPDPALKVQGLEALALVDGWRSMLVAAIQPHEVWTPLNRFKFDSELLLECVRLSSLFRAGPGRLVEIVKRSLLLGAPLFLARPLERSLSRTTKLPGETTIRRSELVLDVSMQLLLQQRSASNLSVCRYGHADSSPLGGFDWLWSQYIEVPLDQAYRVFVAITKLQTALRDWADEHAYLDDEYDAIDEAFGDPP